MGDDTAARDESAHRAYTALNPSERGHRDTVEDVASVEVLDPAESWRLLRGNGLGRLAVIGADGGPELFPVNYLPHGGCVYIRSAPGTKLMGLIDRPAAAFEVDGEDAQCRWSVVLRGSAHRLSFDADIEESGVLELLSWSPVTKNNFIRLVPRTVTGRRFVRMPFDETTGTARH